MRREKFAFSSHLDSCSVLPMNLSDVVNPNILSQPVYEPGRPIEDVAREMGLDPTGIIKLASNENPLGPSPRALAAMTQALQDAHLYPDGGCIKLRERLARQQGVEPDRIVVGNGSNELIELLGHLFLSPGDEVVMGTPAFIVYKLVTLLFGGRAIEVPLKDHVHDLDAMAAAVTDRTKIVFLPCPNNPTGTLNDGAAVKAWIGSLPRRVVIVIDEAYAEYLETQTDWTDVFTAERRLVILRTFSKIYGLAALRLGYATTTREIAELMQRARQPFNVNSIAQAGALAALDDNAWVNACRKSNAAGLSVLEAGFTQIGLPWVASRGNFILTRVGDGARISSLLQRQGVIVRPVGGYGLPEWIRVSVGTEEQNERALLALREAVGRA
jgi:histidinol-phosphate aminotransferase